MKETAKMAKQLQSDTAKKQQLTAWSRLSHMRDKLTFFLISAKDTQITLLILILHISVVHHLIMSSFSFLWIFTIKTKCFFVK